MVPGWDWIFHYWTHWGKRNDASKDPQAPLPGSCERYLMWQNGLCSGDSTKNIQIGRLFWFNFVAPNTITCPYKRGAEGVLHVERNTVWPKQGLGFRWGKGSRGEKCKEHSSRCWKRQENSLSSGASGGHSLPTPWLSPSEAHWGLACIALSHQDRGHLVQQP